jgi:hypothetical protein
VPLRQRTQHHRDDAPRGPHTRPEPGERPLGPEWYPEYK